MRQLRSAQGRRHVNLSTFASFTTLWLMLRLAGFQQQHADIDIRITATDVLSDLDDPELDLVLRYDFAANVPAGAERLFDELLTPVASPWLQQQAASGQAPPLARRRRWPAPLTWPATPCLKKATPGPARPR